MYFDYWVAIMGNEVLIIRDFEHDSFDVAVAFNHVAEELFGKEPFTGAKHKWWLPRNHLVFTTVKVGLNQETKVALGEMEIRDIRGLFNLEGSAVQALIRKSEVEKVENFLNNVGTRLKTASIYKGKAITSSRGFMDLSAVDLSKLVYNAGVWQEIKDNLLVLIEKTEQCRKLGMKIRRKIMFQGKFGAGKTLTSLVVAKIGVENGFTVFYLEPTAPEASGAVEFMLQLSRKYAPTILIIEDWDREQRLGDFHGMGRMMAAIDGMMSKDSETIIIFTTNFKDKIAGGLQRPGRIDKTINFNPFTVEDIENLLKTVIPGVYLDAGINWTRVTNSMSHMTPAFIGDGVGVGATLAAVSRAKNGDQPLVTEEILLEVANGLQDQHKACEAAEQMGFSGTK